jgi:hypothetical protein
LQLGQQFDDTGIKTTPQYKSALDRYNNYSRYSSYTDDQLAKSLES